MAAPDATEKVDIKSVPGLIVVKHCVSSRWCADQISRAEAAGFDNKTVEFYQSRKIDRQERLFRRNDRSVLQATVADAAYLFACVRPYLPLRAEEPPTAVKIGGSWVPHSVNDSFRFYRYGLGQEFPVHKDSVTVKAPRLMSWWSLLVYLNDGFEGGGTRFPLYASESDDEHESACFHTVSALILVQYTQQCMSLLH